MKFHRLWMVALVVALALLCSCRKSEFEKQRARAAAANPMGLDFRIETYDGRTTYHLSERIPIVMTYEAKYPGTLQLEVAEGWNAATVSEKMFWTDGRSTSSLPLSFGTFICCGSRHVWLSDAPVRIPYLAAKPTVPYFSNRPYRALRLPYPGTYYLYAQSQRVFSGSKLTLSYSELGDLATTSSSLKLKILPNDEVWESDELRKTLSTLDSQSASPTDRGEACLRFTEDFGSTTAMNEALNRVRTHKSCSFLLPLANALDRTWAIAQITSLINEPSVSIPGDASLVLATLKAGVPSLLSMDLLGKPAQDPKVIAAREWADGVVRQACEHKSIDEYHTCEHYFPKPMTK